MGFVIRTSRAPDVAEAIWRARVAIEAGYTGPSELRLVPPVVRARSVVLPLDQDVAVNAVSQLVTPIVAAADAKAAVPHWG